MYIPNVHLLYAVWTVVQLLWFWLLNICSLTDKPHSFFYFSTFHGVIMTSIFNCLKIKPNLKRGRGKGELNTTVVLASTMISSQQRNKQASYIYLLHPLHRYVNNVYLNNSEYILG